MKYFKIISTIVLSILFSISVCYAALNFIKIVGTNYEYKTYRSEQAEIAAKIYGKENSLSYQNYPEIAEYHQQFREVENFYDYLSRQGFIDLSYFLKYSDKYQLVGEQRIQSINVEIVEGRNFTQEEIDEGAFVVILNSRFFSYQYKIGDMFEIKCFDLSGCTPIKAEIIGFYLDEDNQYDSESKTYHYMPNNSIKKISDLWMSELMGTDKIYAPFYPVGILNPIIRCPSEEEYDSIINLIKNKHHLINFDYIIIRLDDHYKTPYYFDNNKYKVQSIRSTIIAIILMILIISQEIVSYVNGLRKQSEFKDKLLFEQESNVKQIMQVNQETRKLTHDLRHFFNQLTYYVENNDNEQVLKLLEEYRDDFNQLIIPAYTQNSTIDMIINHYMKRSKKDNIDFTFSVTHVPKLNVNDRKLYILLSNALENAFLHCDKNKNINFNISYIAPYYRLVIVNSVQLKDDKYEFKQGYGIMSMKDIVKEMKGEIILETNKDKFICTILLHN